MYELDLESAVSEISQACENRPGKQSPFFFIVGAGISAPTIPLASEIELECKAIAAKHGRSAEPESKSPIDSYSHWFGLAFPNAEQRQRYLRGKIQGKLISPAVFRLAHLLLSRKAGNIVVTPNFDDFLSRALTLFGEQHVISDHPSTVGRISLEADDVQIVHVHGTYWFYDCCNLKAEIAKRADHIHSGPATIAAFLEHLLWNRSPIVLGYSGWEGDVIMNALRQRLLTPLPFNLYWFAYRRSDCENLPDWVKNNPNVRLIAPTLSTTPAATGSDMHAMAAPDTQSLSDASGARVTLSARKILDHLVTTFRLDAPLLTREPLDFFVDQLGKSIFREESDMSEVDFYSFQSVVTRVQMAARLLEDKEKAQSTIERAMEQLRDALRRSDYRNIIQVAKSISTAHAEAKHLEELITITLTATEGLNENRLEQLDGYEVIARSAERLELEGLCNVHISAKWAKALFLKGVVLRELNRCEEAIAVCDELIRRFGNATEAELQEQVGKGLNNKGRSLDQLNRHEDAIRIFSEVVQLFGGATEPELRVRAASALINKNIALNALQKYEDAIAACDEVLRSFDNPAEPAFLNSVASAMCHKAWNLSCLRREEDAISLYRQVVRRFRDITNPDVSEIVAKTYFNIGWTLMRLDRGWEAIAAFEDLRKRLTGTTDLSLLEIMARGLITQAQLFKGLNQSERMVKVCSEILLNFDNRTEQLFQECVREAQKLMSEGDVASSKAMGQA